MVIIIMETSVETRNEQGKIQKDMDALTGPDQWSIDLGDCQKVLRVVAANDMSGQIMQIFRLSGFHCSVMDIFHCEELVS